jgi:hypothetical protein
MKNLDFQQKESLFRVNDETSTWAVNQILIMWLLNKIYFK